MTTPLQIRLATSFEELARWGAAYDRFLDRIGDCAPFYRLGWLRAIWPAYSLAPSQLYFLGAWDGDELVGLAPFQRMQKGLLQGRRRVLHFIGAHHYTLANPCPDFLVAREDRRADCLQAFAEALRRQRGEWDQLDFIDWPNDSPNRPFMNTIWPDSQWLDEDGHSAQILVEQDYDTYFASLSANLRNHLRRHRRRLEARETGVAFHATDHLPADRWSAVARMHRHRQEKLRAEGRQERQSIFENPVEAQALYDALMWAEEAGHARHYWLDIQGVPAAFILGLRHGETYYYYFVGMDEPAEPYSGGLLLLWHLSETEAREHGTRCIDLGLGMNRNKQRFVNRVRRHYRVQYQNRDSFLSVTRNRWVDLARSLQSRPRLAGARP